jgi:uncharacterized C2H2 Zn-finger protein
LFGRELIQVPIKKEWAPRTRIVKRRNGSREALAEKGPKGDRGELEFQCPECGYSGLNVYQQAWMVASDVESACKNELMDGGMDETSRFGEALFECARCASRLTDAAGNPISENEGLVNWLKDHCER